jgi:hypothetical protein
VSNLSVRTSTEDQFISSLINDGPSAELVDAAETYGWLVGSWDVRVIDYDDVGTKRSSSVNGILHGYSRAVRYRISSSCRDAKLGFPPLDKAIDMAALSACTMRLPMHGACHGVIL